MPASFEAAVGPPPRAPFACLADNDLALRVLLFFEDFLGFVVAMVCSPSDAAESFPADRCFNSFDASHSASLTLCWLPLHHLSPRCGSSWVTEALSLDPPAVIRRVEPDASLS